MFGEDYSRDIEDIRAGRAKLAINRSKAIAAAGHLAGPRLYAHLLWTWIHFLIYPAALISMFWFPWWWGLIALVVNAIIVFPAVRSSAATFVAEYAMENNGFMAACIMDGTLIIRRDPCASSGQVQPEDHF
jgi:hypothetical protein